MYCPLMPDPAGSTYYMIESVMTPKQFFQLQQNMLKSNEIFEKVKKIWPGFSHTKHSSRLESLVVT